MARGRRSLEKAHFGGHAVAGRRLRALLRRQGRQLVRRCASATARRCNLTDKLGVRFDDETSNTPEPQRAYGVAGWTDGDRSVLVYDRYDIWELRPDGDRAADGHRWAGRKNARLPLPAPDAEERAGGPGGGFGGRPASSNTPIATDKPLLLSTTDDTTKATGYFRVTPLPPAPVVPVKGAKPVKKGASAAAPALAPLPGGYAEPVPPGDARQDGRRPPQGEERRGSVVFTLQRFEEFPNLWVADADFAAMKKVSDANPQQAQYNWGRSELIEYVNADGKTLGAILTQARELRPVEEIPADGLHLRAAVRRAAPLRGARARARASTSPAIVSNGYVVLQPDIVYETGLPRAERAEVRPAGRRSKWCDRASSTRRGSASRATAGAATRSPT